MCPCGAVVSQSLLLMAIYSLQVYFGKTKEVISTLREPLGMLSASSFTGRSLQQNIISDMMSYRWKLAKDMRNLWVAYDVRTDRFRADHAQSPRSWDWTGTTNRDVFFPHQSPQRIQIAFSGQLPEMKWGCICFSFKSGDCSDRHSSWKIRRARNRVM